MGKSSTNSHIAELESIGLAGIVYEVLGTHYLVCAEEGESEGEFFKCKTIKSTQTENPESTLVVVGDRVLFKPFEDETLEDDYPEGVIHKVYERKMRLARKRNRKTNRSGEVEHVLASNIQQLVIVASATNPPLRKGLIDRYIAFAEAEGLEVLILVNKLDLTEPKEIEPELKVYTDLGYKVLYVSATNHLNINKLRKELIGKISVLSGHSGVGKSSLINSLLGEEELKTGDLSQKSMKGAHVTSSASMLLIESKNAKKYGYVIDTPGIREFSLIDIDRQNLRHYFIEFSKYAQSCKYTSCMHINEPECGVLEAVEAGEIDPERYTNYLAIFDTLEDI